MQGCEPGPDDNVQEEKDEQLVKSADEAARRETPQEQKLESARKVTQDACAQAMPRRIGSGDGRRKRIVWRRVQRSASRVSEFLRELQQGGRAGELGKGLGLRDVARSVP